MKKFEQSEYFVRDGVHIILYVPKGTSKKDVDKYIKHLRDTRGIVSIIIEKV